MKIIQTTVGMMEVFCYLVYDEETRDGILIDPAGNEKQLIDLLSREGVKLRYIVNTHGHADHTCGNGQLKQATGAPVVMHALDDEFFQRSANKAMAQMMGFPAHDPADITVQDGDELTFGNITMKFIHTPGHTPGACCILVDGNLFTGDTLFVGAAGRTDLPGGSMEQLLNSIHKKIIALPSETVIWPGHNYGASPKSTIAHEKNTNPYVTDFMDE